MTGWSLPIVLAHNRHSNFHNLKLRRVSFTTENRKLQCHVAALTQHDQTNKQTKPNTNVNDETTSGNLPVNKNRETPVESPKTNYSQNPRMKTTISEVEEDYSGLMISLCQKNSISDSYVYNLLLSSFSKDDKISKLAINRLATVHDINAPYLKDRIQRFYKTDPEFLQSRQKTEDATSSFVKRLEQLNDKELLDRPQFIRSNGKILQTNTVEQFEHAYEHFQDKKTGWNTNLDSLIDLAHSDHPGLCIRARNNISLSYNMFQTQTLNHLCSRLIKESDTFARYLKKNWRYDYCQSPKALSLTMRDSRAFTQKTLLKYSVLLAYLQTHTEQYVNELPEYNQWMNKVLREINILFMNLGKCTPDENLSQSTDFENIKVSYHSVLGGLFTDETEIEHMDRLIVYSTSDDETIRRKAFSHLLELYEFDQEEFFRKSRETLKARNDQGDQLKSKHKDLIEKIQNAIKIRNQESSGLLDGESADRLCSNLLYSARDHIRTGNRAQNSSIEKLVELALGDDQRTRVIARKHLITLYSSFPDATAREISRSILSHTPNLPPYVPGLSLNLDQIIEGFKLGSSSSEWQHHAAFLLASLKRNRKNFI